MVVCPGCFGVSPSGTRTRDPSSPQPSAWEADAPVTASGFKLESFQSGQKKWISSPCQPVKSPHSGTPFAAYTTQVLPATLCPP